LGLTSTGGFGPQPETTVNAQDLHKQAVLSTKPYISVLTQRVLQGLELGYVARWLSLQDESVQASALKTALEAIDRINAWFYANAD
jgi:hypothetical protein